MEIPVGWGRQEETGLMGYKGDKQIGLKIIQQSRREEIGERERND